MANATFEVTELRVVIKQELTELYVATTPASDGMLGVGGWYKKVIPASVPALDALREAMTTQEYLLWDRGSPES
jgi:hypothetical protein